MMEREQQLNELIEQLRSRGLANGSSLGQHSGLYEAAADELERLRNELEKERKKLSHVKAIGFVWELGPYREDRVALFNANRISEEKVMWHVRADAYDPNVLVLTKEQWVSLFKDGREPVVDE